MRHAGIVDEDRHRAEALLRHIESCRHRRAIADVGLGRDRFAAGFLDPGFQRREAIGPPRHQHDRSAVFGQHFGETDAKAAR